jgi:hypothetical protein
MAVRSMPRDPATGRPVKGLTLSLRRDADAIGLVMLQNREIRLERGEV